MDDSLIYIKTAAGELAVIERTRLIQRNLRIVLILVDGHTTVGALKGKVGDPQIVDSAMAELEQIGLIELRGGGWRHKIVPEPEVEVGSLDHVTVAPAMFELPSSASAEPEPEPVRTPVPEPEPVRLPPPPPPPPPTPSAPPPVFVAPPTLPPEHSVPGIAAPIKAKDLLSGLPGELPGAAGEAEAAAEPSGLLARWRQRRQQRRTEREERNFEQAYQEEPAVEAPAKPVRRRSRAKMGWLPALMLGVVGFLLVGAVVVVLFPYDRYLPELESSLGKALGSSVKVAGLRFALSPYPNLTVERLSIGGNSPYAEIDAVRLVPDVFTLFSERPGWRSVQVAGVRLHSAGMPRAARWFADGSAAFTLQQLTVSDLTFDADGVAFEALGGDVEFDQRGVIAHLVLANAERSLRIEAIPSGSLFRVNIAATAWTIPFHPGVAVGGLDAKGELSAHRLSLSNFDVRIHDGLIEGNAVLDWSDGASLVGDAEMRHANLGKVLAAIEPELRAAGEIDGKAHVEARGRSLPQLLDGLRIDGSFAATRVEIAHFDVVEAVRSSGREPVRGGSLRVDRLDGSLQCDERTCRATNLRMGSGLMRAGGSLTVARRDGRLDGAAQVEMRGTANVVNAQVAIGGTLARPELQRR